MNLSDIAVATLKDRYMLEGDVSPEDVFYRSVDKHCTGEHLERMRKYIDNQWFVPSTPCLANGNSERGSEIACFLPNMDDSRKSLNDHFTEVSWLSSNGGGVGGCWSGIRSVGERTSKGSQSNGVIPFLGIVDRAVLAFAQGGTRRASYAAYMDVSHPEIMEFVESRKPTGGDFNRKLLNLHNGVVVSDAFMKAVKAGDGWDFIDPHSKEIRGTVPARQVWEAILEMRVLQGEPYILFKDNANRVPNAVTEALGIEIEQSNLCTEILSATRMPDGRPSTGVCCLGSLNMENYDEYADEIDVVVRDCLWYLWLVLDNFIRTNPDGAERAVENAAFYRDVGLGTVGWHSYLQRRGVPFASTIAMGLNHCIYRDIRKAADLANLSLLDTLPACPASIEASVITGEDLKRVFTHMLAIAPNASTALFVDTSGGVEPYLGNAVVRKTASGTFLWKNKHLEKALEALGMNNQETWYSIQLNNGSVQHLPIPQDVKDVFKTAYEINQYAIIQQAADRQKFLDHTQSINLFVIPDTPRGKLNKWHFKAWELGLPTLYYVRSVTKHRASAGLDVHKIIQDDSEDCLVCSN